MAKRLSKKLIRVLQVACLSLALPFFLLTGKICAETPTVTAVIRVSRQQENKAEKINTSRRQNIILLNLLRVIIIYLIFMPILWGALLLIHPLMLLRIEAALASFSKSALGDCRRGKRLRELLMLSFFVYHKKVLDAWISKYINEVRSKIKQKEDFYLPAPVMVDGNITNSLSVFDWQGKFREKQCYMLIWGEPGVGKSNIAYQIAKWAMAENSSLRLCSHLMLPIIIEEVEEDWEIAPFIKILQKYLSALINEVKPISEELLRQLLLRQRLLVIVDGLSEMSATARAEIQPDSPNFPVKWLVVTSRLEEKLGNVVKNTIQPLRIEGSLTSSFLEDYISERKMRSLFSEMEFIDACRDFYLRMGQRNLPAMMIKMYAELMIAHRQGKIQGELSANIPAMMLQYLSRINDAVISGKLDNYIIQQDTKLLAWECLKDSYQVASIKRKQALAVLGEKSNERFDYLEKRLCLVTNIDSESVGFTLEPLAEYLAGLQVVEVNGDNEEAWHEFLKKAKFLSGGMDAIKTFLLAVRDCCLSEMIKVKVPDFVVSNLEKITGLKY